MTATLKTWPADAVMIVASAAGTENRNAMQSVRHDVCRDCGREVAYDGYTLRQAERWRGDPPRPIKFFCIECCVLYDPHSMDVCEDHRRLNRGGYSAECPYAAVQLRYMGGGHPGCGGFCEALEIAAPAGVVFLLQEYRVDRLDGPRYRWRELPSRDELLDLWPRAYTLCQTGEGFGAWSRTPWWESSDGRKAETAATV
jgi:hypothetical protein